MVGGYPGKRKYLIYSEKKKQKQKTKTEVNKVSGKA